MVEISEMQEFVSEVGIDEGIDHMYLVYYTIGQASNELMRAQMVGVDEDTMDQIREMVLFNIVSAATQFAVAHDIDFQQAVDEGYDDMRERAQMQKESQEMLEGLFNAEDENELDQVFADMIEAEEDMGVESAEDVEIEFDGSPNTIGGDSE